MTIHHSVESLGDLFLSEAFISDKNKYVLSHQTELHGLQTFLNSIEINKNYYRTGIHVKNPKYKKQVSDDTLLIKSFKSSLNKMSSLNYIPLCSKLVSDIGRKSHLYPLLIQSILEQSLLHHTYCKYYAELVERLHSTFKDLPLLEHHFDECYQKIVTTELDSSSEYSNLCSKNKQVDQLIGYSIFISELEMKGIVHGKIDVSIQSILNQMKTDLSEDELYKCVLSLTNIFKVVYSEKEILPEYITCLTEIKDTVTFMKIKFKIMDILEGR
jgi:hypothetical protein